jgi:hypothetical protein
MLMLDVRNAITKLLDRYTLADIVEITLRKLRRDKVTPSFLARSTKLPAVLPPVINRQENGQPKFNLVGSISRKRRK